MISGTPSLNFANTSSTDYIFSYGIANTGYVIMPFSGTLTYSIPNNITRLTLRPSGLLPSCALTLPVPFNNQDGKIINIFSNAAITVITIAAPTGYLMADSVTSLLANAKYQFQFCAANLSWYRIG